MTRIHVTAFCGLLALAGPVTPASADNPRPDAGKFTLRLQGKPVGTDTFRLLPDGSDSDVQIATARGPAITFHQVVKYTRGKWSQVTTNAGPLGVMTLNLAGAGSSLKVGDKPPATQKLPAVVYPYGDRSPHLMAFLLSAYDTKRGGSQHFDLVYSEAVSPLNAVIRLAADVKAPEPLERKVEGKQIALLRFPLTLAAATGPIDMEVLTDSDRHILYWSVPAQNYSAVRAGFEDLSR